MIQRRQTLYLLTIVILGALLCYCSVLQLTTPESEAVQRMFYLRAFSLEEVTPELDYMDLEPLSVKGMWGLAVVSVLIPLLALVDIFLYRKRILQARLNVFLAVLCLGYYAFLACEVWFVRKAANRMFMHLDWDVCVGACIPLVCLVLTFGATRLILRDEAMVRSANRIR